jgi:hypothetical protein
VIIEAAVTASLPSAAVAPERLRRAEVAEALRDKRTELPLR